MKKKIVSGKNYKPQMLADWEQKLIDDGYEIVESHYHVPSGDVVTATITFVVHDVSDAETEE